MIGGVARGNHNAFTGILYAGLKSLIRMHKSSASLDLASQLV